MFDGVHWPPLTVPQVAVPVLWERSVAQVTVAELPTTSERYGYRCSADETAVAAEFASPSDPSTASIATPKRKHRDNICLPPGSDPAPHEHLRMLGR